MRSAAVFLAMISPLVARDAPKCFDCRTWGQGQTDPAFLLALPQLSKNNVVLGIQGVTP